MLLPAASADLQTYLRLYGHTQEKGKKQTTPIKQPFPLKAGLTVGAVFTVELVSLADNIASVQTTTQYSAADLEQAMFELFASLGQKMEGRSKLPQLEFADEASIAFNQVRGVFRRVSAVRTIELGGAFKRADKREFELQ